MSLLLLCGLTLIALSGVRPLTIEEHDNPIVSVGCYDLSYSLSNNYHTHIADVTFESCVSLCLGRDTRYAGIEKSDNFCYCGNDIAEESVKRDDNVCNVPCSINSTRTCGGDWLMTLYDLEGSEPSPAPPEVTVGFLIGLSGGIRLYNSTSIKNWTTVMVTSGWAYTLDYHYAKNLVFTNTKGSLFKSTLNAGFTPTDSTTPTLVSTLSTCDGFVVDWVHDKIFWADCKGHGVKNKIMSMDLEGGSLTSLAVQGGEPRGIKRMEIDPYNGMLFWLAEGTIESCETSGNYYRTNLSNPSKVTVRALSLDITTQRVYFVGAMNSSTPLLSMDYNGGSFRVHFEYSHMNSVFGLGIHNGYVYWVNYARSKDIIYMASLDPDDAASSVQLLTTIDKAVWHMKVVHPDTQKPPSTDPCAAKGCSHICTFNPSTSAVCECPQGRVLGSDHLTCYRQDNPSTPIDSLHYVGCFDVGHARRRVYHHQTHDITLGKCVQDCIRAKMRYAGVDASEMMCYCGPDIADLSSKVQDSYCNEPCLGDNASRTCGGDWLMSVYDITGKPPPDSLNNSVSFIIGLSETTRLYNSTNMDKYSNVMITSYHEWAYNVDFHLKKNLVFVSTRRKLYRSTLEPKLGLEDKSRTLVHSMGNCEGFAVDWVHDIIYWADCENHTISSMNLEGKNESVIRKMKWDEGVLIKRMEVDPYRGAIFWLVAGAIESCDLSGKNFQSNLTSRTEGSVRAFTLDLAVGQVLFVMAHETIDTTLYTMDYWGGNVYWHFMAGTYMDSVYGLGLVRGYVYWTNYNNMRDTVYKAPLNMSDTSEIVKLKTIEKAVWHMKVLHPDLQMAPSGSLICYDEEVITTGKTSCIAHLSQKSKARQVKGIVLGVLLMVVIVIVAALLLYVTDKKYWENLRAKLPTVPYHRERHHSEDDVNLI